MDPAPRSITSLFLCVIALGAVSWWFQAPSAGAAAARPGQTFTLAWGGDVTPGSSYGLPPSDGQTMLASVADVFKSVDLAAVNLEGTLGRGGNAKCGRGASPNCFAFQAPAANAAALWSAGVDLANLANNHAFDYGAIGARLTVQSLERFGVRSTGRNGQISVIDLPRTRVAALGFAAYPWASPIRDLRAVRRLVARAARRANVVVVFMHAGAEGGGQVHTPNRDEQAYGEQRGNPRAFARAAVDAGADIVLGSGPHVLRGIELYRNRLIAYSLGNLAGYRNFALGGNTSLSGIVRVRLGPEGAFAAGAFTSLRLTGPGLPSVDPTRASGRLVSTLSSQDFGRRGVRILSSGEIVARG